MPKPMSVTFEFSISELDALNALYSAIHRVRANHSSVEIMISSRQKESLELPVESIITIAASGGANSNGNPGEVMEVAKKINEIIPIKSIK